MYSAQIPLIAEKSTLPMNAAITQTNQTEIKLGEEGMTSNNKFLISIQRPCQAIATKQTTSKKIF